MKILAHRGASYDMPENTMEAFRLAMAQGADGFELDVHLTADGHIVVTHDEVLERVSTGAGNVCDYELEALRKLSFSKLHPGLPPCLIPTLAEVYELVAGTGLIVNVELKTSRFLYPQLSEKLIALEREYGMTRRVIYSSFNHYSLVAIKKIDPQAKIGLLYMENLVDPWAYAKHLNAAAIHPHFPVLQFNPEIVQKCREEKIKVNVWTVDEPQDIDFLKNLGVDAIITNKPLICKQLVQMGK
ncbi:MAG: glycerophosphodiester phosphodiesterase [Defluviitaleaceae bacterium]|nr:glycerophosphodiester phosphodiesterase [Defluviitaleaceae bacterium]